MKTKKGLVVIFLAAALMALTAACGSSSAPAGKEGTTEESAGAATKASADILNPSPDWVAKLDAAEDADQLFVVAQVGETTAYVSMHEKDADGNWKEILTTPGFIGKSGLGKTKEGDAKTPVGVYHFNYAFGIADDPGCVFPYQKVTEDDYWSGDQRDGYHYNEMVSIKDLPDLDTDESEHIVEYPYHYQYCMNISWNEKGEKGKGSAIFLHCLGPYKPYTGGCVAIPQDKVITAMQNVKKDCVVVIDTLKNIAPDYYDDWDLGPGTDADDTDDADDAAGSEDADDFADASIDYGTSKLYSKEDMEAAIKLMEKEFDQWEGCEMHSIRYAGDDCNSDENIKWVNELEEGKNYTQCIQFNTDFHSPVKEEDLKNTAWEPDQEYKDYQWTLARTEGGDWELLSWGY